MFWVTGCYGYIREHVGADLSQDPEAKHSITVSSVVSYPMSHVTLITSVYRAGRPGTVPSVTLKSGQGTPGTLNNML